ncbi:hypothetical protein CBW65_17930 [Tumebacillus avium]|uniref:HTH cro/C1-type domain-containing protein n=1 Tax=Tumebacillus avium TaxID=1903704 RepID=A0A1Y0IQ42_9BACL|nr:helix-turn-helix transcriptional regulator [Tumebacillus avium]ARU62641.1 hypothetical protein CBW65_17930 [Tumebacillus avium]
MSQLLAPAKTVADGIPLWRRIRELMKEKGSRYSMSAVAGRLEISRETLRLMLNGEREIYWFELEKIAEDLKMPMARILQEDVAALHAEIATRKKSLQQLDVAMEFAKKRFDMAQGLTEKGYALLDIGYLHLYQEQFADAERVYLAAYEVIQQIGQAPQEDDEMAFQALAHLAWVYVWSKQHLKALDFLEQHRTILTSTRTRQASYLNRKGLVKQSLNELAEAKQLLYQAMELVRGLGREEWLGRVCISAAYVEYLDLNYSKAKDLLIQSLLHLQTDTMRLLATKDLVKVYLKLHERQAAEALIRQTLREEPVKSNREMEARLRILLSRTLEVPFHAEAVAGNSKYPKYMRLLASRFLRIFYRRWFLQGRSKRVKAVYQMPRRSFPYDKFF